LILYYIYVYSLWGYIWKEEFFDIYYILYLVILTNSKKYLYLKKWKNEKCKSGKRY